MKITIDTNEVAIKLADENVSFKTENKVKVDVGVDYTIEDCRYTLEWQQNYNFYVRVLKSCSEMPLVSNDRGYKTSEFVKDYAEKNKCSVAKVYKLIKFKQLKVE